MRPRKPRDYRIEHEGDRRVLVAERSGWKPEYAEVMRRERINRIGLTWVDADLAFLDALPTDLRALTFWVDGPRNLSGLERFSELEELNMNLWSRRVLPLSFEAFPKLRVLRTDWNKRFASLFEADLPALQELYLAGQPHETLAPYDRFRNLRSLRFGSGTTMRSIEGLSLELDILEVYRQPRLHDLAFTEGQRLRTLDLQRCMGLGRLDGVERLSGLERLMFNDTGPIESLRPLASLVTLREVLGWESTNVVDGDLAVLLELPELEVVAFASRRHYKPSIAAIKQAIQARRA